MRFLDLSRATEGREACSQVLADDEWQRRLTVDPNALVYGGLDAIGVHLAQESFHPSAAGHAELGRCVGEFLRGDAVQAACRVGADGRLHATARLPRSRRRRPPDSSCRPARRTVRVPCGRAPGGRSGFSVHTVRPPCAHGARCARRPGDLRG